MFLAVGNIRTEGRRQQSR